MPDVFITVSRNVFDDTVGEFCINVYRDIPCLDPQLRFERRLKKVNAGDNLSDTMYKLKEWNFDYVQTPMCGLEVYLPD